MVHHTADLHQEPNSDHICRLATVLDDTITMMVQPGLEGLMILKVIEQQLGRDKEISCYCFPGGLVWFEIISYSNGFNIIDLICSREWIDFDVIVNRKYHGRIVNLLNTFSE